MVVGSVVCVVSSGVLLRGVVEGVEGGMVLVLLEDGETVLSCFAREVVPVSLGCEDW